LDAEEAIGSVTEWILWRDVDYPTDGLVADRFEAGWCVYAPLEAGDSNPRTLLRMPVGDPVFLIGDSGRIEEVPASALRAAQDEFIADELAARERDLVPAIGPEMVLDTEVNSERLLVDPEVITYGLRSIALDQVEWVRYWSTTTEGHAGPATSYETNWHFSLGTYPFSQANMIDVVITMHGKDADEPDTWLFLVYLSQQYLEPQLLLGLYGRIYGGETFEVAGVRIRPDGFGSGKVSLPWQSVRDALVTDDQVLIYQAGASDPVLVVPLEKPNAVLLWRLLNLLAP
jgi:hypothetical protein